MGRLCVSYGACELTEVDEWSLRHVRLRAAHGGWGLVDLLTEVRLRALRSFVDAGASLQTLGPLAVDMWARIQTEHTCGAAVRHASVADAVLIGPAAGG